MWHLGNNTGKSSETSEVYENLDFTETAEEVNRGVVEWVWRNVSRWYGCVSKKLEDRSERKMEKNGKEPVTEKPGGILSWPPHQLGAP